MTFFYQKLATASNNLLMLLFTVNELEILKTARLTLGYSRKKNKQQVLRGYFFENPPWNF